MYVLGTSLMRSRDDATSWHSLDIPPPPAGLQASAGQLMVDPVTPATIYLTADVIAPNAYFVSPQANVLPGIARVFRSEDSGDTWQQVNLPPAPAGFSILRSRILLAGGMHTRLYVVITAANGSAPVPLPRASGRAVMVVGRGK
jgi:hypothetical protein